MAPDPVYRKTKNGVWVVYGPADTVTAETTVTVAKKSGESTDEYITGVGRPFTVDGVEMVYGYTGSAGPARSRGGRRRRRECVTGGNCSSFGDSSSCGGYDCDGF